MNMDKEDQPQVQYPLIYRLDTSVADNQCAINQSFAYDEEEPCIEAPKVVQPTQPVRMVKVVAQQPSAYPSISAENLSAIGVPQAAAQPDNLTKFSKYQKSVKCWSKFLVVLGYILVFNGFIQIGANVIFILMEDQFTNVGWTENGVYKSIRIKVGDLFLIALFKIIVGGVFVVKQGKMSIKIFGDVVKEYREAENGETNGIRMERKSNLMKTHKKQIKKIIFASLGLGFFAMLIGKDLLEDIANQYIEGEFQLMNKTNSTGMTFAVDPTTLWVFRDSERNKYGEYGDTFEQKYPEIKFGNDTLPTPVVPDVDPIWDDVTWADVPQNNQTEEIFNREWKTVVPYFDQDDQELNQTETISAIPEPEMPMGRKHHKHHGKHHHKKEKSMFDSPTDMKWNDDYDFYGDGFDFDMSNMTQQEAKNVARFWISVIAFLVYGWTAVVYLWMQAFYLFCINRVIIPQKKLEKKFMGPEVAAIPNSQATIQTINVEQHQVQPNYVYYQPGTNVQQAPVTGHIQQNRAHSLN